MVIDYDHFKKPKNIWFLITVIFKNQKVNLKLLATDNGDNISPKIY